MESPKLKYKKMAGFATTFGQQYEVHLAALLLLRGLNSGLEFQLGTNVHGAGALDDIVFRFKPSGETDDWTTLFVQLKHKARKPISRKLLTNPSGDFSLVSYFKSFLEIKQAMSGSDRDTLFDGSFEKCTFVIFTNAKDNHVLGTERFGALEKEEEFLSSCSGSVFSFEEDEEILNCLGECGDEGKAFIRRLRVFCGQPNANSLKAAVEIELHKVDKEMVHGVDFQSVLDCFLRNVKNWCEKSNDILHKGNDLLRSSVLEMTSRQTRKEFVLDIEFAGDAVKVLKDALTGACRVYNIKASEGSCRLTLTKILQAVEGRALVLASESLTANKVALLSQWRHGDFKTLIICTNDWNSEHSKVILEIVREMCVIRDTNLVAFLSNGNSCVSDAVTSEFQESAKSFKDTFLFSELENQSREEILAREIILQGHSSTLGKTFNGVDQNVDTYLDSSSVVEILSGVGGLSLGSALGEGIGYYVDRSLELATMVKASVFQDDALRKTVTVRVMLNDTVTCPKLAKWAAKESRSQPVSDNDSKTGFIEKIIRLLSTLSESSQQIKEEVIVNKLTNSPLVPETDDAEVNIGPKIPLGIFECNSVALRSAGSDTVTALRVRTSKHASRAACFLFVSEETNENDTRKLSDLHQSKHLLSLVDGQLRWIQSLSDIEFIRPHIEESEKQAIKLKPKSVMDVEDRLVLVCAEPGMGKSTLMARLAGNLHVRDEFKDYFVITIALNDQSQLFAERKHTDIVGFLCSASKIETHLHKSLLKHALEISGDVVVLFDGYDEIAPKYGEQCCDLVLSILEKTRARKIWLTSRNTFKNHLETFFSKFALKLCKFDKVDQKSFLKMFWEGKSKLLCKPGELDAFIDQLLEKTSHAVRDKERNLMGIPLQTQMLAEVYEDHVTTGSTAKLKIPDTLDLLVLMEQFVDKKCSIYVQDKFKIEKSKVANYEELYDILKSVFVYRHMKAALGLILDDDIIKSLHMESIINESSEFFKKVERGKDKTGFIDAIVNGKPRFIHRVFAEYFVAAWIAEHVTGNAEWMEAKMFTDDFAVVRNVFDRSLAKGCALHTAVIKEDLEEVRTLLVREDVKVDAVDGGGRTALHLAASLGTSDDREENERRGEILELLVRKTSDFEQKDLVLGGSPLKYAALTKSWIAVDKLLRHTSNKKLVQLTSTDVTYQGMLETIFDFDLHNLLGFCLDNGLPVEHYIPGKRRLLLRACEKGSLKVAFLLVERNADIKTNRVNVDGNEDENSINTEVENQTALLVACQHGHIEIARLLLRQYFATHNTVASGHEVNDAVALQPDASEYINIKDAKGNTALHKAAKHGHSDIVTVLIGHGGDARSLTYMNATPLHFAAQYKKPGALKVLLEALDEADRAAVVNQCDIDGDSVLGCAAWGGCVECVHLVRQAGGALFQAEFVYPTSLSNLENRSTVKRTTPLHRAVLKKHIDALRVLLESLDEADRAAAVNQSDNDGDSVLSCAASGGCLECIHLVIQAGGTLFPVGGEGETSPSAVENAGNHEFIVGYSLKNISAGTECGQNCVNYEGGDAQSHEAVNKTTPFHRAASKGHHEVLLLLLGPVDEAARAVAVNACDDDGDTVLYNAAWGGCVECVKLVLQFGGRMTSAIGTPLMAAAIKGNQEVASCLLTNFNAQQEGICKLDFINLRNENGKTAIFLAAKNGHRNFVSFLIHQGGDPHIRNYHNSSPLHIVAENRYPGIVSVLLESLDEDDRADAVNSCDNDGDSVLMCAALGGCDECVGLLIQAGGTLSALGRDGEHILIAMASRGSRVVLDFLLQNYNAAIDDRDSDSSDLSGFLHSLASDRRSHVADTSATLLHRVAINRHPGTLRILLEALDEADREAAVNCCDKLGDSVLMMASRGGCVECVALVVKAGGKFCQVNNYWRTPLMQASVEDHLTVVKYLLSVFGEEREGTSKMAYIAMSDKDGKTAFDLAESECSVAIENWRARLIQQV